MANIICRFLGALRHAFPLACIRHHSSDERTKLCVVWLLKSHVHMQDPLKCCMTWIAIDLHMKASCTIFSDVSKITNPAEINLCSIFGKLRRKTSSIVSICYISIKYYLTDLQICCEHPALADLQAISGRPLPLQSFKLAAAMKRRSGPKSRTSIYLGVTQVFCYADSCIFHELVDRNNTWAIASGQYRQF